MAPCEKDKIPNSRCNRQQDRLQRTAFRHAKSRTDNMQRSAWHHAEKIRFKIPDATDSKIGCNGQHCDMQQAEPTTCNVAPCCFNLQHAALLQPAACNMHNGQHCNGHHATCNEKRHCNLHGRYHATYRIATCNGQHCNGPPWCRGTARACAVLQHATARAILTPF